MTGLPSGRCAATEALKVIADVATKPNGVITNEWYYGVQVTVLDLARAALASPCCVTADQEQMKEALEEIEWYVRCLEDIQDGRPVRGLAEAKAGYDVALALLGKDEKEEPDGRR